MADPPPTRKVPVLDSSGEPRMRSKLLRIMPAVTLPFLLLLPGWASAIPICLRAVGDYEFALGHLKPDSEHNVSWCFLTRQVPPPACKKQIKNRVIRTTIS